MTVHSGIFEPVHTGILSGIELRCTTPSAASGALLHHFSYGAERRRPTPSEDKRVPSHVLQASPCPGAAASHSLWPSLRRELLHLRYVTDYTFSSRGLGLPRGDIGPLLRRPGLALVRFVVFYIFRGGLVDSRAPRR